MSPESPLDLREGLAIRHEGASFGMRRALAAQHDPSQSDSPRCPGCMLQEWPIRRGRPRRGDRHHQAQEGCEWPASLHSDELGDVGRRQGSRRSPRRSGQTRVVNAASNRHGVSKAAEKPSTKRRGEARPCHDFRGGGALLRVLDMSRGNEPRCGRHPSEAFCLSEAHAAARAAVAFGRGARRTVVSPGECDSESGHRICTRVSPTRIEAT